MAEKYIKIRGKLVAVSEEVHYTYYHMGRQHRTQAEKEKRRRVASYDALDTDENLGIDMLIDEETPSVEDQVLRNLQYERLRYCISQLTDEEQEIIFSLYYEHKTEREYAKTLGISQKGVNKRRHKALAHLRVLIEK